MSCSLRRWTKAMRQWSMTCGHIETQLRTIIFDQWFYWMEATASLKNQRSKFSHGYSPMITSLSGKTGESNSFSRKIFYANFPVPAGAWKHCQRRGEKVLPGYSFGNIADDSLQRSSSMCMPTSVKKMRSRWSYSKASDSRSFTVSLGFKSKAKWYDELNPNTCHQSVSGHLIIWEKSLAFFAHWIWPVCCWS